MADEELEFAFTKAPRMPATQHVMYVPNHRSFGAFMRSEQMRDVTGDVADDIAKMAGQLTPESTGGEGSRGLHTSVRNGFKVKRAAGQIKVAGNMRVKVEVTGVAGSALLEFGAKNLGRTRALGRAGAMFGDFKPEGGPE